MVEKSETGTHTEKSLRCRYKSFGQNLLRTPEFWLAIATILYIALSAWWLDKDTRVIYGESGKHLSIAAAFFDNIKNGNPGSILTSWTNYPPILHIFGVFALYVGSQSADVAAFISTAVFVPILVTGVYFIGKITYSRLAGALAGFFVLAMPMLSPLSHMFMLELPLAAITAVTVWFLLASDRFTRWDYSIAAGVVIALGMLTKQTFIFALLGIIPALLVRGGWRNWRQVALCAGVVLFIASPWYLIHLAEIIGNISGAADSGTGVVVGYMPPRWSIDNLLWYFWNLLNNQLYLPLTVLVFVGTILCCSHFYKTRSKSDYTPELVAGGVVGYFVNTFVSLDDPRYTFPLLVFIVVLATGWLAYYRVKVKVVVSAFIITLLIANTAILNWHVGKVIELHLFSDPSYLNANGAGTLTVTRNRSFYPGEYSAVGLLPQPSSRSNVEEIMRAVKHRGVPKIFLYGLNWPLFSYPSLIVMSRETGIVVTDASGAEHAGKHSVYMINKPIMAGDPKPCKYLDDGNGLFVVRGKLLVRPSKFRINSYQLWCPL